VHAGSPPFPARLPPLPARLPPLPARLPPFPVRLPPLPARLPPFTTPEIRWPRARPGLFSAVRDDNSGVVHAGP